MKKIIVKPVERESVQGLNRALFEFRDTKTGEIKKGKRMDKQKRKGATDTIRFETYGDEGDRLKAGMGEMVDNPFLSSTVEDVVMNYNLDGTKWRDILVKIINQPKITMQTKLEILASELPNAYTEIRLSKRMPGSVFIVSGPEENRTALEKFELILHDGANPFNDSTARQRLAIQLIENSTWVAKNKSMINPNQHKYYISSEFEEEASQIKVDRLHQDTIAKLVHLRNNYPPKKMYKVATLLSEKNGSRLISGVTNEIVMETSLNRFLARDNKDIRHNCEQFSNIMTNLESQPEKFEIDYLIQEGLNSQVLSISNAAFYWHSKVTDPGVYKFSSKEAFATFLYQEYGKYNPKETAMHNYYSDYIIELKSKINM